MSTFQWFVTDFFDLPFFVIQPSKVSYSFADVLVNDKISVIKYQHPNSNCKIFRHIFINVRLHIFPSIHKQFLGTTAITSFEVNKTQEYNGLHQPKIVAFFYRGQTKATSPSKNIKLSSK